MKSVRFLLVKAIQTVFPLFLKETRRYASAKARNHIDRIHKYLEGIGARPVMDFHPEIFTRHEIREQTVWV